MKVVRAFVLLLAVSVCAHAGVMDNGTPQPPPPKTTQETTDGYMPNGLVQLALSLFGLI